MDACNLRAAAWGSTAGFSQPGRITGATAQHAFSQGNITRHGGNPGGGVLPKGVYKGKPNYYFNTEGERFHSSKCVLLAHPAGLVVV